MPCKSDYLEPTTREKELQRAAKLLIYIQEKLGMRSEKWLKEQAKNIYAGNDLAVTQLCALLKKLDPKKRDAIVYNAHDKMARDLANWWEEHQKADTERIAEEKHEQEQEKLREQALKKLTKAERRALGLK